MNKACQSPNDQPDWLAVMSEKQAIEFLSGESKRLNAERKRLRSILNQAANCINDAAHGHTPNWHRLVARIEQYEDAYAPLGDNC